jgi:hypothetical protein
MENKKLKVALLTLAVFTNIHTKDKKEVYQPKSPWPLVVVEDAVVGTAGVVTLGQTDADPSALPMTIPDAIPGVSYARTHDKCDDKKCSSNKKRKSKETSSESSSKKKVKKEKSATSKKKTATRKTKDSDNAGKVVTAPVTVPTAIAADIVTLDTQHFTKKTVDSINGDSAE